MQIHLLHEARRSIEASRRRLAVKENISPDDGSTAPTRQRVQHLEWGSMSADQRRKLKVGEELTRCFAGAGRPHKGGAFARFDVPRQIVEQLSCGVVRQLDSQLDVSPLHSEVSADASTSSNARELAVLTVRTALDSRSTTA